MLRIKSNYIFSISLIVYIALVMLCSNRESFNESTETGLFRAAKSDISKKDYFSAKRKLGMFIMIYPGSPVSDSARYMLMEAHYNLGEYSGAAVEGQNLIRLYPNSELADDAQYKVALCYYSLSPDYRLDQENTIRAISEFQALTEDYPLSNYLEDARKKIGELIDKLAEKKFKSAELYKKMGNYEAAKIYFQTVVRDYINSTWAPNALYFIGECEIKLGETEEAKGIFEEFLKVFPEHKYAENAKFWIERINKGEVELEN
jgi:outer membrane protein assembly factor BamD